jgi:hypothetical protein
MAEPTRRLPDPIVNADGKLVGKSALTPEAMKTRGAIAVPSSKVIPVILVPGIMGSNLRATTQKKQPQNQELSAGSPAWRPPNGTLDALNEVKAWKNRPPAQRQRILDGDTLEVDDSGLIVLPRDPEGLEAEQMRSRWWGEVHSDSYGALLADLHLNLNNTFFPPIFFGSELKPSYHWDKVMKYDRTKWNATDMPALTEAELKQFAQYQYPVYACGYNWIQSNELSAERLKDRVLEIVKYWTDRKFDCKQVILVTHSMGGLVGRACAKQIPEKILGVVHGVMPALGAPLAYRRIACGTERSAPGAGILDRKKMEGFSDIAGSTPDRTTPAMATACGALELLPNHLYPPWLFASVKKPDGTIVDVSNLQHKNIYDLYRNYEVWYRLINPELADPAHKYENVRNGVTRAIDRAVAQAEKFHTKILDTYYHPNTYAYFGADEEKRSFGIFRWVTKEQQALTEPLNKILPVGKEESAAFDGSRYIVVPEPFTSPVRAFFFEPGEQDTCGDGTVSQQSGDGPRGKVRRIFRTTGFDHQGSYANEDMLKLTHHLICKIVQEAK